MNGRVYDPVLGRFLSPDPFVQAPGYSNSYNRYAYVLNNPLLFTDPSGYRRDPAHYESDYYNYSLNSGIGNRPWEAAYARMDDHIEGVSWEWDASRGVYYNTYTGETKEASTQNAFDVLVDMGLQYQDPSNDVEVYMYLGRGSWVDDYSALKSDPNGNWEVWIILSELIEKIFDKYGYKYVSDGTATTGQSDEWLNLTSKAVSSLGLVTKVREVAEWEYLRQARINRALSGNFSKPIKTSLGGLKNTGRVLGGAGIVLTGIDMGVNGINVSNNLDLVMGGVAFIPVAGWAISGTYFLANLGTQLITGESIGEHIQGTFTDSNASWKPW